MTTTDSERDNINWEANSNQDCRTEISFNVIDIIEQIIVEALAELNRAITEMLVKP